MGLAARKGRGMLGSWPIWPRPWACRSTSGTGGRPGRRTSRRMLDEPAMNGWLASRRPGGLRAWRRGRRSTTRRRRSCTGSSGGPGSGGWRGCRLGDGWRPGLSWSGRCWASPEARSATTSGRSARGSARTRRTSTRAGPGPGFVSNCSPSWPRSTTRPSPRPWSGSVGWPRARTGFRDGLLESRWAVCSSNRAPTGSSWTASDWPDWTPSSVRKCSASPGDSPAGPNGRWMSGDGGDWAIWRNPAQVGSRSEAGSRRKAPRTA